MATKQKQIEKITAPQRRVAYCPTCGNVATQVLMYRHDYQELQNPATEKDWEGIPAVCILAACETCSAPLVYQDEGAGVYSSSDEANSWDKFQKLPLRFPVGDQLHSSVPDSISELYTEAASIRYRSPRAFAVQIRTCLEAVCVDRAATGRNLSQQLASLVTRGDLPPTLSDMTDVLRLLGNTAAHGTTKKISAWQSTVINEFFRLVVEYIYVIPAKVTRFKTDLARVG